MATNPAFAATPRIGTAVVSTAETNYTAITNFQTLLSGASTGTKVSEIVAKCAGTSAAGVVRLYTFDSSTNILVDEVTIAAASSGNTVASTRVSTTYTNWILPNTSHSIRVTTTIGQPIHITAFAADL